MENRYIDIAHLYKRMSVLEDPNGDYLIALPDLRTALALAAAETGEVVEVVRCKDCRFNTFTQPNGTINCHVDGNVRFSKQNDFCSKGRRKEQT